MDLSDDEWRQRLTPDQYRVLRQKGTEVPGSGELLHNDKTGEYRCAGCGQLLFMSDSRHDSTSPGLIGWPGFSAAADNQALRFQDDTSAGMKRTEVICNNCGGHLGHLFPDESQSSGQHFCINSCALDFKENSYPLFAIRCSDNG